MPQAPIDELITEYQSTIPTVPRPESITHWTCYRSPFANGTHHVNSKSECVYCHRDAATLMKQQAERMAEIELATKANRDLRRQYKSYIFPMVYGVTHIGGTAIVIPTFEEWKISMEKEEVPASPIVCAVCGKTPSQLSEYVDIASDEGMTPEEFVQTEEGTYNSVTRRFYCTSCYIKIGMPLGTAP